MPTYQRFSFLIIFLTSYIVLYNLFSAKIQPNQQPAQKVLLSEKNEPIKSYNGYKFSCSNCKYGNTPLDDARSPFPLNGNEIFIYKAYYDWRLNVLNTVVYTRQPTSHRLLSPKSRRMRRVVKITVNRGEKSVRLKVNFVPKTYEKGITSCLEPLHWFTEWPRLIVFMELYQFLGYTKFLFTWTTMTKTVKKVLDYYVEKGIAELRPYPLVPYTDTASVDEIVYLHARASFAGAKLSKKSLNGTQNLMPDVDLLGKDVEEKLQKIRDVTKEIFGENPPPFSRETSEAMAKCTGNWLQKWRCRKPLTGCFDVVKYMEEWVFAKPSEENGWTIL
ncbi:unnamed protein product, partial [Mesorhabditis belari]|uniref:Glycosyltransferase family 92 protein n=1 Tax=Mesorhabditis belari TaxID=2138241 RepID=A0AAF3JBN0_9BILA